MVRVLDQATQPGAWAVANWVSIPAPWPVDQVPTPDQQQWLLIFTGIVNVDFKASLSMSDSFNLRFDLRSPQGPLAASGRQAPPGRSLVFSVTQWAPYATLNSMSHWDWRDPGIGQQRGFGFAVESFRPLLAPLRDRNLGSISNVFEGLQVDLTLDAIGPHNELQIGNVGYCITLLGRIVVHTPPPVE
jgi:hypothetical protein